MPGYYHYWLQIAFNYNLNIHVIVPYNAGDFNFPAKTEVRDSLALRAIMEHRFGLRSLVTDDMSPLNVSGGEIYTVVRVKREVSRRHSRQGAANNRTDDEGTEKDAALPTAYRSELIEQIEAAIGGTAATNTTKKKAADDLSDSESERTRDHYYKGISDFIFYSPLRPDQPGFRTIAYLDVLDLAAIGQRRLPNELYPSNHMSIGVDFQYLW